MTQRLIYGFLAALLLVGGAILALLALFAFCCTLDVDSSIENAALWGVPGAVLLALAVWLAVLATRRPKSD